MTEKQTYLDDLKGRFLTDRGGLSEINYGIVPVHDNPYPPAGNKGIHWETGLILANIVEKYKPGQIVELGTFRGYSTCWLLYGCALAGTGRVDAFEVFPEGYYGPMLYDQYGFSKTNFAYHEIPNGIWNFKDQIPKTIDLFYHDTDHLAGPTIKEMELLVPRIPIGGHIVIDDVLHPNYASMQAFLKTFFLVDHREAWTYNILPIGCGLGIAERKK